MIIIDKKYQRCRIIVSNSLPNTDIDTVNITVIRDQNHEVIVALNIFELNHLMQTLEIVHRAMKAGA